MSRLRERNDYFEWRGDRYAFHQLVDGPVLARLDPDSEDEQIWTLHSRRVISPNGEEVRAIAKQVHGVDLPERAAYATVARVRDDGLADRVAALEARVAELEAREPAVVEKIVEVEKIVHVEVPAPVVEPAPPYVPDFTLIPDQLAKYAEADDSPLVKDLRARIAELEAREPEIRTVEVPVAVVVEEAGEIIETIPDNLARLVPNTVADQEQVKWLRSRWQELTHRLVDGGRSLEPLSPAEMIEQQELERYRGLFG